MTVLQNRKDFDCKKCKWGRHCDSSNPAPIEQWSVPGVIESKVCLLPMITERSLFLIRLHKHYKQHLLFEGGGLMTQPNLYLEAMELLESAINE